MYPTRYSLGVPVREAICFPLEAVFPPKHVGRAVLRYLGPHHLDIAERAFCIKVNLC